MHQIALNWKSSGSDAIVSWHHAMVRARQQNLTDGFFCSPSFFGGRYYLTC
jgi:hypothetical protein